MTDDKKSELAREIVKERFHEVAEILDADIKQIIIQDVKPGVVNGTATCRKRVRSKKSYFFMSQN